MQTVSTLPQEVRQAYDNALLKAARPNLVHIQFCEKRPIPKNQGRTINMRRFELLSPQTTPLTEGTPPSGSGLSISQAQITVAQYGDFVAFSDFVTWTAIDPLMAETADIQGYQAGETIDTLAKNFMNAGTSVQYPQNRLSREQIQATDVISDWQLKHAVRTLEMNAVPKINGYYIGIVSPMTKYDIQNIPEFQLPRMYVDPKDMYLGELGELFGIRFVMTPLAMVFSGQGAGSTETVADPTAAATSPLYNTTGGTYTPGVYTVYYAWTNANGSTVVSPGVTITIPTTGNPTSTNELVVTLPASGSGATGNAVYVAAGEEGPALLAFTDTTLTSHSVTLTTPPAQGNAVAPTVNTTQAGGAQPTGGVNVYSTLIFGDKAFGCSEVNGESLEVIAHPAGSAGAADPLNQQSTQGWKCTFGGSILNNLFVVRNEHAVTS